MRLGRLKPPPHQRPEARRGPRPKKQPVITLVGALRRPRGLGRVRLRLPRPRTNPGRNESRLPRLKRRRMVLGSQLSLSWTRVVRKVTMRGWCFRPVRGRESFPRSRPKSPHCTLSRWMSGTNFHNSSLSLPRTSASGVSPKFGMSPAFLPRPGIPRPRGFHRWLSTFGRTGPRLRRLSDPRRPRT